MEGGVTFIGQVYDFDAFKGYAQVLIADETTDVALLVSDEFMYATLVLAAQMRHTVEVTYTEGPPNVPSRVKLNLP